MTAIRPRPTPEQQRREEARAHARARTQAQTNAAKANRVLLSQPLFPLLLAIFYIALLIIPWVLECKIASQPSFIVQLYRWGSRYYVQNGWVIAINVLNSLAVVLSLPILSALLARAAVVFSQRRKPGQTLTVRQLFALADRGWYDFFKVTSPVASSALLRLGFLVLFIAVLLPLVRSGFVAYDNLLVTDNLPKEAQNHMYERLGFTPSPVAVKSANSISQDRVISATRKKLLTTVGGIEPNLWPVCNDNTSSDSTCGFKYGPYDLSQSTLSNFWEAPDRYGWDSDWNTNGSALMHASALTAGSSIGSYYWNDYGAYTLGLKSGTRCEAVSAQVVEEQCLHSTNNGSLPPAAHGWNTSLEIQKELRVDICYPALETSPWQAADASPWKPISFTEHLYIGIRDQVSSWDCSGSLGSSYCGYQGIYQGLYLDCQADSMMSFFELGSARTKGVPSRFLEELPSGFDIPRDRGYGSSRIDPDEYTDYIGPLKTAALAMFGNDSWFDTLNLVMADIEVANITNGTALAMLCQMIPLGNIDIFGRDEYCDEARYRDEFPYYYTSSEIFSSLVRSFFQSFRTRKLARATLNTATFFANNATLSGMNDSPNWESQDTKYVSEKSDKRMLVPVLSVAAIATISIFIALQVACIVILLVYIYSSRVWTLTLDSLAIARIGAQLSALDVFLIPRETGTLGTAQLNSRAAKQLDQIDGLVGSTSLTGHHDIEMVTMPPPYAPRGEEPSTRDERRLPQPGAAAAARDTATQDHTVPAYSPPADEHTAEAAGGEAGTTDGRHDANEMAISHAASSESRGPVLPAVTSLEAIAVGGRGLITRRMWRQADKPLPEPPAEQ